MCRLPIHAAGRPIAMLRKKTRSLLRRQRCQLYAGRQSVDQQSADQRIADPHTADLRIVVQLIVVRPIAELPPIDRQIAVRQIFVT